ncbi:hypothetical protein FE781_03470 [Paenibacillus thermoaerophilus]|nr:hypothetical protein FE781_03470 [Paenibacillus thermoaerophilus]
MSGMTGEAAPLDVNSRKPADVYSFLQAYIERKEQKIAELEQIVERYLTKRMAEEQAYRRMSPIRRMFAGKKPDHQFAVEYFLHVKKPLEQIRLLRQEAEAAKELFARNNGGVE